MLRGMFSWFEKTIIPPLCLFVILLIFIFSIDFFVEAEKSASIPVKGNRVENTKSISTEQ
jgi:hypothetical protein